MSSIPNLFAGSGINLAQELNRGFQGQLLPTTLIKVSEQRDPNDSTKMIPSEVSYPNLNGFTEDRVVNTRDRSLGRQTIRVITIMGGSLPSGICPEPGDKITIEGSTSTIVPKGVSRDPAGATFECTTI